jgi:hypothetical protein
MNNEPVAWTVCLDCGKRVTGDSKHICHPVKELTDEEIKILATQARVDFSVPSYVEFARTIEKAILKKAQEK